MGDIALPSSEKLRALAQSLGTAPDDLLQAAGYIDSPSDASELPDIKVYLRRKYAVQDPRILQAIETIINNLQTTPTTGSALLSRLEGTTEGGQGGRKNEPQRELNHLEDSQLATGSRLSSRARGNGVEQQVQT